MADFEWPEGISPYAVSFYLQAHTGGSESTYSRTTKVYGLSAPRWVCRLSVRGGDSEKWGTADFAFVGQRMDAFIAQLQGRLNRVQIYDFRRPGGFKEFVNGAVIAGDKNMTLTGAVFGDIRLGEYIGGDGRPHIITALDDLGGSLLATVEPPFVNSIGLGGATYQNVTGTFRLTSDDAGENPSAVGQLTEYSLEFVEDVGGLPSSVAVTNTGELLLEDGSPLEREDSTDELLL